MPNRILRDWTDSKAINKLSFEQEVLFTRLIMKVDDFGNFHADELLVKSLCFPRKTGVRTSDISAWLKVLELTGLIRRYEATGDHYLHIPNFKQRLDRKSRKFPKEPDSFDDNQWLADDNQTPPETKRSRNEVETETKHNPASPEFDFIELINSLTGKKFKATEKIRSAWKARQKEGYSLEDVSKAVENAMADSFHIENKFKYLTAEFFTRPDKLENWLNAVSTIQPKPQMKALKGMDAAMDLGKKFIAMQEAKNNPENRLTGND